MFKSATLKLTFLYLLIIMAISLFFSVNLYNISTIEINNSLQKQQRNLERGGRLKSPLKDPEILDLNQASLEEAKNHLIWQLIYINIAILALGGAISYFMARFTLKPIEEAHEKQGRFVGDASHELRSPLAAMKSEIEVTLREKDLKLPEAKQVLESNLEEVNRLNILVEGLLELARDNAEIKKTDIKLSELTEKAFKVMRMRAKEKNIKLKNDYPEDQEIFVNSNYFEELLQILFDNAIKYSEKDKMITVEAKKNTRNTEIKVIDQGLGIKESDISHIFERFYRADISRSKNKIEGYGLGLPLAKKIVEMHHGNITVSSKIGDGSTFTITIPNK